MHSIRQAVTENRLADPGRVTEADYRAFIEAGTAWVVVREGEILGFSALDRSALSIWALFIAPHAEGSGVGHALQQAMLQWAEAERLPELWLTTAPGTRAERFYLASGWKKVDLTADGEVRFHRSLPV